MRENINNLLASSKFNKAVSVLPLGAKALDSFCPYVKLIVG